MKNESNEILKLKADKIQLIKDRGIYKKKLLKLQEHVNDLKESLLQRKYKIDSLFKERIQLIKSNQFLETRLKQFIKNKN